MATLSHPCASSQDNKAARQTQPQSLCTPTSDMAKRNYELEVYWCVKHQLLELRRCGKLRHISCAFDDKLIEELHAYVMYKLFSNQRCEGRNAVEPDQFEQHIRRLVHSWHQRNNRSVEPKPRRSESPPRLKTFREMEKMLTEEIIFSHTSGHYMENRRQSRSQQTINTPGPIGHIKDEKHVFSTEAVHGRWMLRIPPFISFFRGSKSAQVSSEPHSDDALCHEAKLS